MTSHVCCVLAQHSLHMTWLFCTVDVVEANFQRFTHTFLSGVPNCEAYPDNIVVYSGCWHAHLETLQNASLTLNLPKCDFAKAMVIYLVREVSQGQVRPLAAKIQAILDYPAPLSGRELHRFLGMAGDYYVFCKNVVSVVVLLTHWTSAAKPFVLSPRVSDSI